MKSDIVCNIQIHGNKYECKFSSRETEIFSKRENQKLADDMRKDSFCACINWLQDLFPGRNITIKIEEIK